MTSAALPPDTAKMGGGTPPKTGRSIAAGWLNWTGILAEADGGKVLGVKPRTEPSAVRRLFLRIASTSLSSSTLVRSMTPDAVRTLARGI